MSRVVAGLIFVSCVIPASAQTTHPTHSLFANVLDRNGNAVRDLTKDSFRVEVNRRPAVVLEATYSAAPRRIAVLLDISGSMAGDQEKKWRIAHEALDDLLAEVPAGVPIALLTFSDHVHDMFDFSQSRESVAAWIKEGPSQTNIRAHGRTAIYDAVAAASKMFGTARPGDAIYVITDGGDNCSHVSETAARKIVSESGIRFFVFLLSEPSPMEAERDGKDGVIDIARTTGGFVFGVSSRSSATSFLPSWNSSYDYDDHTREKIRLYTEALYILVNGFYTLQLDSSVTAAKVRRVSLDVLDEAGNPRKDVAFMYSSALRAQPGH